MPLCLQREIWRLLELFIKSIKGQNQGFDPPLRKLSIKSSFARRVHSLF